MKCFYEKLMDIISAKVHPLLAEVPYHLRKAYVPTHYSTGYNARETRVRKKGKGGKEGGRAYISGVLPAGNSF